MRELRENLGSTVRQSFGLDRVYLSRAQDWFSGRLQGRLSVVVNGRTLTSVESYRGWGLSRGCLTQRTHGLQPLVSV